VIGTVARSLVQFFFPAEMLAEDSFVGFFGFVCLLKLTDASSCLFKVVLWLRLQWTVVSHLHDVHEINL
jgi:hypothetical protein